MRMCMSCCNVLEIIYIQSSSLSYIINCCTLHKMMSLHYICYAMIDLKSLHVVDTVVMN